MIPKSRDVHIVNSKNVNKKLFRPIDHLELFLTNDPIGVTEVKLDYHRPTDKPGHSLEKNVQ